MTQLIVLAAVLVLALSTGVLLRRGAGRVRASDIPTAAPDRAHLLARIGLNGDGPTVLHFSADWCGPCAAVRRVVSSTVAELADSPRPPAESNSTSGAPGDREGTGRAVAADDVHLRRRLDRAFPHLRGAVGSRPAHRASSAERVIRGVCRHFRRTR